MVKESIITFIKSAYSEVQYFVILIYVRTYLQNESKSSPCNSSNFRMGLYSDAHYFEVWRESVVEGLNSRHTG